MSDEDHFTWLTLCCRWASVNFSRRCSQISKKICILRGLKISCCLWLISWESYHVYYSHHVTFQVSDCPLIAYQIYLHPCRHRRNKHSRLPTKMRDFPTHVRSLSQLERVSPFPSHPFQSSQIMIIHDGHSLLCVSTIRQLSPLLSCHFSACGKMSHHHNLIVKGPAFASSLWPVIR